jgi:hypothetical protein
MIASFNPATDPVGPVVGLGEAVAAGLVGFGFGVLVGAGVSVGTGVSVGGTRVNVAVGTGVSVGGTGVSVGTGVFVVGSGVFVGIAVGSIVGVGAGVAGAVHAPMKVAVITIKTNRRETDVIFMANS